VSFICMFDCVSNTFVKELNLTTFLSNNIYATIVLNISVENDTKR
jgi:hypothetical protein